MFGAELTQGMAPGFKPREILFFAALAVQLIGLLLAFGRETVGG